MNTWQSPSWFCNIDPPGQQQPIRQQQDQQQQTKYQVQRNLQTQQHQQFRQQNFVQFQSMPQQNFVPTPMTTSPMTHVHTYSSSKPAMIRSPENSSRKRQYKKPVAVTENRKDLKRLRSSDPACDTTTSDQVTTPQHDSSSCVDSVIDLPLGVSAAVAATNAMAMQAMQQRLEKRKQVSREKQAALNAFVDKKDVQIESTKSSEISSTSPQLPRKLSSIYKKVVGGRQKVNISSDVLSPQLYLEKILAERNYPYERIVSLDSGYHAKPTVHQKASYGVAVVQAVRQNDEDRLAQFVEIGISRNPCNAFGESLIHMICRRGQYKLLKYFVDHGACLQVSDDFGRTPMHDACWTVEPAFECVELLLKADIGLLNVVDCRGSTPLSYVRQNSWQLWNDFFDKMKDIYWPIIEKEKRISLPPLTKCKVIEDPSNASSTDLTTLLSSGKVNVSDVKKMSVDERKNFRLAFIAQSGHTITKKSESGILDISYGQVVHA